MARLYLHAVEVQVWLAAGVVDSLHILQVDHKYPVAEAIGNLLARKGLMLDRTDQQALTFVPWH